MNVWIRVQEYFAVLAAIGSPGGLIVLVLTMLFAIELAVVAVAAPLVVREKLRERREGRGR